MVRGKKKINIKQVNLTNKTVILFKARYNEF